MNLNISARITGWIPRQAWNDGKMGFSLPPLGFAQEHGLDGVNYPATEIVRNARFLTYKNQGSVGYILSTRDGGETWSKDQFVTGNGLYSVKFLTRNKGWIVGENGMILHTTRGGYPGL